MDTILFIAIVLIAIFVVMKLLSAPIRWAGKLLINALVGFVILFLLNFVGSPFGITLGINWLNAIVVGVLGAPGVVLLLLLKFLL